MMLFFIFESLEFVNIEINAFNALLKPVKTASEGNLIPFLPKTYARTDNGMIAEDGNIARPRIRFLTL